jgi:hypothetical protein
MTRLEWEQGLGIGCFGGLGLVLQMDGLAYTHGSTSAFLTQGYCVLIPIWVAVTHARLPGRHVVGACSLVVLGAAILAGVTPGNLRLGRGEWETLAGSVMFSGQILWLERPRFAGNDSRRASVVMFAAMALVSWPLAAALAKAPSDLVQAYASPSAMGLMAAVTVICTMLTFPVANHWQPKVSATQAGILYCTEPVFTSALCLVLPAWLSRWTGIPYANEQITWNLLIGGACILAANLWLIWRPPTHGPAREAATGLAPVPVTDES